MRLVVVTTVYERHEAFGFAVWRPVGCPEWIGIIVGPVRATNGRMNEDGTYTPTYELMIQRVRNAEGHVFPVPLSNPQFVV